MKWLENLSGKFEGCCKELAVFGFNSAGYDIKLIKEFLFKELFEHRQQPTYYWLESILVSRLNTLNSWTFSSF